VQEEKTLAAKVQDQEQQIQKRDRRSVADQRHNAAERQQKAEKAGDSEQRHDHSCGFVPVAI
jgi:hypothetical protein